MNIVLHKCDLNQWTHKLLNHNPNLKSQILLWYVVDSEKLDVTSDWYVPGVAHLLAVSNQLYEWFLYPTYDKYHSYDRIKLHLEQYYKLQLFT